MISNPIFVLQVASFVCFVVGTFVWTGRLTAAGLALLVASLYLIK